MQILELELDNFTTLLQVTTLRVDQTSELTKYPKGLFSRWLVVYTNSDRA